MRTLPLFAALLLSACATQPPLHAAIRHSPARKPAVAARPVAKAAPAVAAAPAAATTAATAEQAAAAPVASPATPVSAPQPGSAVPLLGFRPMRGQPVGGA